jgi:hypothetical protein
MIRNIFLILFIILALAGWGAFMGQELKLQELGVELAVAQNQVAPRVEGVASASAPKMEALLEERASAKSTDFTSTPVNEEELALLLWSTSGKNRAGTGYVTPMAMGVPPYVDVYVADALAIRFYDGETNSLREVKAGDFRRQMAAQDFVRQAPQILVCVISGSKLPSSEGNFGEIAVGAMTENVYLLAGELGVKARYIASIDGDGIRENLPLKEGDRPVAVMPLSR